jgi:hypothetical protein
MIQFKAIDAGTDMVIATSGVDNSISYNRIISSAASPSYSVDTSQSKTFRHTSLVTTTPKTLRGLFIIDKDHLVSLIYD